jgi:hypothetical protein
LKKKLAVMIASIAAASFILGTMLNLNLVTTAKDDGPKPVWPTYITGVNATALPDDWNVTVTNWPISTDVSVWWEEYVDSSGVTSPPYNSNGFGKLHVLVATRGLPTTQTMNFLVYGLLSNATRTEFSLVLAEYVAISGADPRAVITIPVPSEEFFFYAYTEHECEISMSFYLTWA